MGLDGNGIWQYDESEDAAPFSEMLNRGQQSVSDAIEQLVYASGPHNVPGAEGVATSTLQVERVGRMVEITGSLTPTPNWGALNALTIPVGVGGIPADCAPGVSRIYTCPAGGGTASVVWRVTINADGSIQARCNTASATTVLHLTLGWLAQPV